MLNTQKIGKTDFLVQLQYAFKGTLADGTGDVFLRYITGNKYYVDYSIKVPDGYRLVIAYPNIAWFNSNIWRQEFIFYSMAVSVPSGTFCIGLKDGAAADTLLLATLSMICIFVKE